MCELSMPEPLLIVKVNKSFDEARVDSGNISTRGHVENLPYWRQPALAFNCVTPLPILVEHTNDPVTILAISAYVECFRITGQGNAGRLSMASASLSDSQF